MSEETEPLLRQNQYSGNSLFAGNANIIASSYEPREQRDGGTHVRLPISGMHSINEPPEDELTDSQRTEYISRRDHDFGFRLRLNLIRKVDSRNIQPPNHVIPSHYFIFLPFVSEEVGEQSSIITVLAIWNTMLGTSILCIPWALQEAGFVLGIGVLCFMALVCWYTSYLVIRNSDIREVADFSTVCHERLGNWARILAIVFSLIALAGAMIVYFVLLCNFLFHVVEFLYHLATPHFGHNATTPSPGTLPPYPDVVCPSQPFLNGSSSVLLFNGANGLPASNSTPADSTIYGMLWQQYRTTPFWLLLLIFPLVSLKSPTFFTKFNALGAISILFLVGVVIFKLSVWGIHFDIHSADPHKAIPLAKGSTFVIVAGIGSLALFIHNAAIAIMKNQRNHENNVRDLTLGYILGLVTYLLVGCIFYIGFPLPKSCIEDNLLNNLTSSDLITTLARAFLFFQMMTVFPLLVYIFRSQLMNGIFNDEYPSWIHVALLNLGALAVCIIFAMFLPSIGSIIRFVGAFCGMVYIFTLPVLVQLQDDREKGKLNALKLTFYISLIVMGVAIFIGQLATIK